MIEFIDINFVITISVAVITGSAAGILGTFMVLKRMALVGDALSHVALPGVALALIFNINPFFGAFVFLAVAILATWWLEDKTELPVETLVGVFFTAALAVGVLIFPEHELIEALFGDIATVGLLDGILAVTFLVGVLVAISYISKSLLLNIISKDLALTTTTKKSVQ